MHGRGAYSIEKQLSTSAFNMALAAFRSVVAFCLDFMLGVLTMVRFQDQRNQYFWVLQSSLHNTSLKGNAMRWMGDA